MTTIIVAAIVAGLIGYIAGRAQERGRFHSSNMNPWKASCLAMALQPRLERPTLELTAARVQP